MHLRDRIMFSDILRPYIPDFKYIVVRNHDFSDEELLAREDEMSLLMLINKFQTADDITNFREIETDKIDSIIQNSSEQVIDIIAAVVHSLCTKIHISEQETDDAVRKVREHKLGYLFENMEKIDIQQLRKDAEDERKKVEEMRKEADAQREKVEEMRKEADAQREKLEEIKKEADEERKKADEERKKAETEQIRVRQMALIILRNCLSDRDYDLDKVTKAVEAETDTDKIMRWVEAAGKSEDKEALYKEIIEN